MRRNFMIAWGSRFLVVVLLAVTPRAFSQTIATAEITGVTRDSSDALVRGATVLLKSVDTGASREVQSNASGAYRFTFVKPGTYEISAASAGLKSDIGRVAANVGHVQVLNLRLNVQE